MKQKERLDQLIVNQGLMPSREAARTAIMDGGILVDGNKITKPGQMLDATCQIVVLDAYKPCPYVSRGGYKLKQALDRFAISVAGRTAIDAGASTGGFTDCLLQHGARLVYAVDVGYGQIAWSLRTDDRVKVIERANIRYLTADQLYLDAPLRADLAVCDLSFISLKKILPNLITLLATDHAQGTRCEIVSLIKPQFEVGKEKLGKGGVVREKKLHAEVIKEITDFCRTIDLDTIALTYSPVKGPAGNIEFLVHLALRPDQADCLAVKNFDDLIIEVVQQAHTNLN